MNHFPSPLVEYLGSLPYQKHHSSPAHRRKAAYRNAKVLQYILSRTAEARPPLDRTALSYRTLMNGATIGAKTVERAIEDLDALKLIKIRKVPYNERFYINEYEPDMAKIREFL